MRSLNRVVLLTAFVGFSITSSGCGVYMAFNQPPAVDTAALEAAKGMTRDLVIERLGGPKSSTKNSDGSREEIYEFYEGSAAGWKAGRGVFHLVADIMTFALWEIVATPMEYAVRGDKLTARADFDARDRLTVFKVLRREEKPLEKIHRTAYED